MHFIQLLAAAAACAISAQAKFMNAANLDAVSTVDLGEVSSLDAFFTLLGTNASQWIDITEYDTPNSNGAEALEAWRNVEPNTTVFDDTAESKAIFARQPSYCEELTGFARIVCENMPERYGIWAAGGALLIYYAPGAMTTWLENLASAIRAGRDVKAAWIGNDNGGGGGNPVDDRSVKKWGPNTNLAFSIPAPGTLGKRSLVTDDGSMVDMAVSNEYLYNTASRELLYQASQASFSVGLSDAAMAKVKRDAGDGGDLVSRQTLATAYTILLRGIRVSSALTIASPRCIGSVIRQHMRHSSERHRFGCFPIDNNGQWRGKLHVNINKGRFNYGTYGSCC